jgi:tetratricopeptide (TPR) repeat protein
MKYFRLFGCAFLIAASASAQLAPVLEDAPEAATLAPVDATPSVPAVESPASEGLNDQERVALLMDAGVKYTEDGEYGEAKQAYLRALDGDPGNMEIRFRLGTLCIQMGDYEEAASRLETLLQDVPGNPMVLNNLAWIYATGNEMKDGKRALYYAREAILSEPLSPSAWNTLAEAHYISGEYKQALRASEFAGEILENMKPTNEQRAEYRAQYQKIQRALESYKMMQAPGQAGD